MRFHSLIRHVTGDARPDADLLARVGDDDVFAELVARHGPVVWGVCRNMLAEADAEDAFQATFVALLRSRVRNGPSLAAWLHAVAVRACTAVRRESARRRNRERVAAVCESLPPSDDWSDTMAVVHREVSLLPAADRDAFVLCVLEGLTQAEAAARLERPVGAIAGQVARAKKRLVARLTGRGIAPALATLGTGAVAGAVPPHLVERLTAGAVSPAVLRLAKGVTSMSAAKLIAATVVLGTALAAGILAASPGDAPEPAKVPAVKPERVAPTKPSDAEKLRGVWRVVKQDYPEGKRETWIEAKKDATLTFADGHATLTNMGNYPGYHMTLDEGKRTFVLKSDNLDGLTLIFHGRYRFDGDELRVCIGEKPTEDMTPRTPGARLLHLERVAKADKNGGVKEPGEGKKAEKPREALALKADLDGDTAKVTVAFNYTGKPGDPATFQGVRLYKYDVPVGKGPTAVGLQGKEGRQATVLGGKKYHHYPAPTDRQENGSLSVAKDGEKIRVTGVYHAYGTLFVIDETVKPGDPILLEDAP